MRLKVSNVCQVFNKEEFIATTTRDGITFTNNGDGSFTINGTATANVFIKLFKSGAEITGFNINHKYLICGNLSDTIQIFETLSGNGARHYEDSIFTCVRSKGYLDLRIVVGTTATNYVFRPQLFDLTAMYGVGNEPTTIEQFRQDFPNEMYEYSPECWKKFRRLKYIANKQPVQLLDKSKFVSGGESGITATVDISTGIWTITGTATTRAYVRIEDGLTVGTYFDIGDVLLLRNSNADNANWWPYVAQYDANGEYLREQDGQGIFTVGEKTQYLNVWFNVIGNKTVNTTSQFQLFNLTRMYGKGNEPTAAEFVAQYPGFDYPVNKYNYLTLNRGKYIANKEPVQLLNKNWYPEPISPKWGIDVVKNSDGTFTLSGTATNSGNLYEIQEIPLIKNHKYYIFTNQEGSFANIVFTVNNLGSSNVSQGNIWTYTNDNATEIVYFGVTSGTIINNRVYKPQLFDLTAMYGAGNEPTTVGQFRVDFPNELYDYNPYNAITFR